MRARPLVRSVRRTGVYEIRFDTSSLPSSSLRGDVSARDAWHYGGLRIVIVSRITEDRTLHCGIRANIRSTELIRAKISLDIYISAALRSEIIFIERRSVADLCGNYNNRRIHFNAPRSHSLHTEFNPVKKKLCTLQRSKSIYRLSSRQIRNKSR